MKQRICSMMLIAVSLCAGTAGAQGTSDWAGWYAGAFGGYMNSKVTAVDPSHFEGIPEFKDNLPLAGIMIGLNRVTTGGLLFGAELIVPLYIKNGEAVETLWYPDADPPIKYVADFQWGLMIAGKAGKPMGALLPYGFVAIGMAGVDGKTLNVNEEDVPTPGFEQKASATHLVYQIGGGADYQANETMFVGCRIGAFNSDKQEYLMPWNSDSPPDQNKFGINSLLLQAHAGYRF